VERKYAIGDTICDEYVVRLPLGEGGMGEVYLVEHTGSGELRAAKIMRVRQDASADDFAGFRQEAVSLLNVGTHPFIVRLFDVRERERDIVLVMEYVAPTSGCTTVEDYVVRKRDYTDRLLGAWAVQFCVGMERAFTSGLVAHRDIKPQNLMIDSGAFLKIADFGLALAVGRHPLAEGAPKTLSHLQWLESVDGRLTCGTPGYIAPELFKGGKASQRSDMFSFGVTLWQLAARSLASPYGVSIRGNAAEYQRAVLERAMIHRVGHVDTPLFEVIRRCLAPDPMQRYPDFPTLREAIKGALKAAKIPAIDFVVAPGFHGSLDDYVNRGRSYLLLGRAERALAILDKAVKLDPNSHGAHFARADALAFYRRYVEAIRSYETARDLKPEEAEPVMIGIANSLLALDLPQKARSTLAEVLERQLDNVEALLLLAHVTGVEGDNQAALQIIARVIALDPRDWRAHEYHGRALRIVGKPADAVGAYRTCLGLNPLAIDARLGLASVLTRREERVAAAKEYNTAVRLFRDDPETLNRIAAHMSEGGHEESAIDLFRSLASISPDAKSMMLVNVGNAQLRLDDEKSAAASFLQAVEADPENALAHCRLGDLEFDAGRNEEAAEYYARACELEPDNWRYHKFAGTAYLQNADYDQAIEHLRRSVEIFPEQPLMLYNLAVTLCQKGEEEAALEQVARAVQIDEGYARGWYIKALIESHLGLEDDAKISVRRAIANRSALSDQELQNARELLDRFSGSRPQEAL
jgi:tetratricopeptide (TPR) repeat protein